MVTVATPMKWVLQKARVESTIQWFGKVMASEMEGHADKGTWDQASPIELLEHLRSEVDELEAALKVGYDPDSIIRECADASNISMLIADRTRTLKRMNAQH